MADITNISKSNTDENAKKGNQQRQRRERGPPADGIPSKTKVMVANLPYDLTEEKVSDTEAAKDATRADKTSLLSSSRTTSLPLPRSPSAPSLAS